MKEIKLASKTKKILSSFLILSLSGFADLTLYATPAEARLKTSRVRVQAPPTYEYINKKGERAIPYLYHLARPFSEGLAAVLLGEEWGYIDKDGVLKIGAKFKLARDFSEGYAPVKVKSDWGYTDTSGEIAIKPKFAAAGPFKNGVAVVYVRKGPKDFPKKVQKDADTILKKDEKISQTKRAFMAIVQSRRAGYIDRSGSYIIKPKFTAASPFSEGLALVRDGKKVYFIDKTGEPKIEPVCENAKSFSDGLAAVKVDKNWGFIDKFGKQVIKPQYTKVQKFYNGLAAVKVDKLWGFIDKKGKWAIEPQYSFVWNGFKSGVAVCAKDVSPIKNSFGSITKFPTGYLISRRGAVSKKFDESTTPLEPGYFSYPDYRFGLVDKTGKEIASFKYSEIGELSDGLRKAEYDGRFGYIDNIGNQVVKPKYKSAAKFSNGIGMVKNGPTSSRRMKRAQNLLKHSVPTLVNDPELIKKDIAVASEVIKLDPDNAQAFRDRGYFYCCLQDFKSSLDDFGTVIKLCPISTEGYYWRGHSYLQLKQYQKAVNDFTAAIKMKRTDERLYSGRAQAYMGLKKNKYALVDLARAIKLNNRPFYHNLLAKVYKELGQKRRAIFQTWRSRRSTNLNPWPAWAKSQQDIEKELSERKAGLDKLSKVNSTDQLHEQEKVLAITLYADSVDTLRRLKFREQKMLEIEALLTKSFQLRTEALSLAKSSSTNSLIVKLLTNDLANSVAQLASWYTGAEKYKKAEELTNKALSLARTTKSGIKQADYLNDLAKLYLKQKRYKEAEPVLKKSLVVSKGSKRTLMKIIRGQTLSTYAILLVKTNRDDEAEKMLRRANEHLIIGIKLAFLPSPPHASADTSAKQFYELAVQCRSMGLVEVARQYLLKAIELAEDPELKRKSERFMSLYLPKERVDLATAKTYLTGRTAEVAGDFISAERFYTGLTKSQAKFYWPHVALARIYRENGQLSKAEKHAKKALSINKNSVEALIELSKINKERGRISRGISNIEKALKLDPDSQLAQFESDIINKTTN